MHGRAIGLGTALLLATLGTEAAHAEQRAADPVLGSAVALAVDYWADRGVTGCPDGITADWARFRDPYTVGLYEPSRPCRVLVRPTSFGDLTCSTVVHEVGHALGLGHSTDPRSVMAAEGDATPWECHGWAQKLRAARSWARSRLRLARTSGT